MFTPRRGGSRSSPFVTTTPALLSRSRLSATPSTPFGRSPRTPGFLSQSQHLDSSLHRSEILEETADHVVEIFGADLPVLVGEAIVKAEPGTDINARISSSGWAWLVCGRKLFVWQYEQDARNRRCRMLMLPPSDLAHRADLACILLRDGLAPAALAVSPAGILRYWPNIAHEGSSTDALADLQGEECCSLTDLQPIGCVLATTTSSLMLVTPTAVEGQTTLVFKPLRAPQGILAGIGRRVSSFIFGAMPSQSSEVRHLVKVLAEPLEDEEEKYLYVLMRNSVQKWYLEDGSPEKLCCEYDLDRPMKEQFHSALWDREDTLPRLLKAWCIDMQLTTNGVTVLMAALNPQVSQQLHFALGTVDLCDPGSPAPASPPGFSEFSVLRFSEQYTEKDEEALLGYKFVLPSVNRKASYVYNDTKVFCISPGSGLEELDVFKRDRILGAGSYKGMPLFFSEFNGFVRVRSIHAPAQDVSHSVLASLQEPEDADLESTTVEESHYARLRSAFILFCKSENLKSEAMVDKAFPGRSSEVSTEPDSALDQCVCRLARRLTDDVPVSDPRWVHSRGAGPGSSSSLLIHHQLEDKQQAHRLLVSFLKDVGLWNRLYAVTVRGSPLATNLLLQEHAEKLVAAIHLHSLQVQYGGVVDDSIRRVIQGRQASPSGSLTAVDHFYQQVSEIDAVFPALVEEEEEALQKELSPKEAFELITLVNAVLVKVLQEACLFREKEQQFYESDRELSLEHCPWTSALRDVLCKQHALTVTNAVPLAGDAPSRGQVFQQLTDLTDLVLAGYKVHLDSLGHDFMAYERLELKFQQDRSRLIGSLVKASQYERAAALAEKYFDFGSLVEICEATSNKDRLQSYMSQFAEQGFSEFVFKWQLDSGRRGDLLRQPPAQHRDLERFLEGHDQLSWLHHIQTGQFGRAAQTLERLGKREEKFLARKKTLFSLSKLAALASNDPPEVKEKRVKDAIKEHDLIMYQESLPPAVMEAYCLDPDNMRVLSPEELIEMYVSKDNVDANEYDFMKALELLDFIPDSATAHRLRMHVWCQAMLRDQWEDLDTDRPLETMKELLFFRIVELAFSQNVDLKEFLPWVEDLLDMPELSDVKGNPNVLFMLKAGYEHIERLIA
ncbi:nuclear pore complex protein Nup133 isoform X1 [Ixodes scapularis]|uniref:nuclear pore complex protein Nup133 isoform X1 n=1 Tax=Ixodes scapularis TaxID=6945 RepID=UPI001C38FF53|nr:nuclear pore complex protein Nup133 isoform X1 [Ixodes scapularis]